MFSSVFPQARDKFKEMFFANLNDEEFNWDALVSSIIEEDSPLQEIFNKDTVRFADIYDKALSLHKSAGKLNNDKVKDNNFNFDFGEPVEPVVNIQEDVLTEYGEKEKGE